VAVYVVEAVMILVVLLAESVWREGRTLAALGSGTGAAGGGRD
jgi:hypothetical protein